MSLEYEPASEAQAIIVRSFHHFQHSTKSPER